MNIEPTERGNDTTALKKAAERGATITYSSPAVVPEEVPESNMKYLILTLVAALVLSVVVSCEQPLPLQGEFLKDLAISHTQYTVLLAAYTLPNMFIPVLGGWIFDTLGRGPFDRLSIIAFSSAMCLGQAFVAIGGTAHSYNVILLGRVISALGGDSITAITSGYVYYWYRGKNMGMPMSIIALTGLLASAGCYSTMPLIYNVQKDIALPLWIGFIICVIGLVCAIVIAYLTFYGEKHGLVKKQELEDKVDLSMICQKSNYHPVFWFVIATVFFFYGSVFSAMGISSGFIQAKYGFTNVSAGFLLTIPQMTILLLFPIFGKLTDRWGALSILYMISGTLMMLGMVYLTFSPPCVQCYSILPGTFLFGLGYALYAPTLWSTPPVSAKKRAIGIAYGFIGATRNLGVCLMTVISGVILDHSIGYIPAMIFLSCIAGLAFLSTVVLAVYDFSNDSVLHNAFRENKPIDNKP